MDVSQYLCLRPYLWAYEIFLDFYVYYYVYFYEFFGGGIYSYVT